ncbi:MAG: hypothetical protein GTN73_03505 [Candidatus Aminicenantes bacterium]|nr:hypothetical protein [Candidatus Aminicenantes bacterium]
MTTNSISFEDETYGEIAPDIPNYLFGAPYQSYLHFETHVEFMKVCNVIKRGYEKPMAYGFISHNDIWGADSTAHNAALTTGLSEGYVITKAKILLDDLAPLFISLGLDPYGSDYDLCLEICHHLIESAVDLLIKNEDPQIGEKIVSSSMRPNKVIHDLLIRAYAGDFFENYPSETGSEEGAAAIITTAEMTFRYATLLLGEALKKNAPDDLLDLSQQLADLAEFVYGITIEATDLASILLLAMSHCALDYLAEISATIDYVDKELKAHLFE